jgi:outer membrane protein assembly factor BamB
MKRIAIAAALAVFAGLVPTASHAALDGCADGLTGGEWPSYGGSLDNSRTQLDTTVGPEWVENMELAWALPTSAVPGGSGTYSNTPVVADGCVYVATNSGVVMALNATTGDLVWGDKVTGAGQALLGGVVVGSLAVADGVVFAGVSRPSSPYVTAWDQETGVRLWEATVETGQNNSLINASPVVHDGKVFMGFSGNEGGNVARGGFAILDASGPCGGDAFLGSVQILKCFNPIPGETGGTRLAHEHTISDAEYAAGYRGASIWCTAAIDPVDDYVYACGGNPASKKIEHRYSNALLKIDFDEDRDTFGTIVDSYKGDNDQYYPGLDRQPVCDAFGDQLVVVWSLACLQLDLDFGASPNLFRDSLGNLILGDIQKSGVYHAVYADQMSRKWTQIVGGPCVACNAASAAYAEVDGEGRVFGVSTPGGTTYALQAEQGRYRWIQPVADGIHFQATSTAGGVVFTIDNGGFLTMSDASTGLPIAKRNVMEDTNASPIDQSSQGIAIAYDMVFVNHGPYTLAYHAPSA